MGLFDSLAKLTKDVVSIAVAPVEIAVDIVSVPVKAVAEMVTEVKEEIKKDIDDE